MKNVLNLENDGWKTGRYPLFLGQELGLHDTMNRPYPELFEKFKLLKSLDWTEDEVDLEKSRLDFLSCDKNSYEVMIKTISWQWEGDSLASRSIIANFAPFISNSDLSQMMLRWSDNEALHATTYSEIVRQCLPDPDVIFNEILSDKNITERSRIIGEAFSKLKVLGAQYTLDPESVEESEVKETLLLTLVALYCLEGLEFMASFACTFALAERDLFEGIASLVQKIMIDETVHTQMDEVILDILFKESDWKKIYEKIKPDVQELVDSIYQQELDWAEYIFSEGRSVVGLTEGLLKDWVSYKADAIYNKLSLTKPFEVVKDCPLPWMESKWLDIDANQQAAQEADLNNYRLNSVKDDVTSPIAFDFGSRDNVLPKEVIVYSKERCPYCVKVKDFFKSNDIEFKEIDVSIDLTAKERLLSLGLETVPQVFSVTGEYLGDCSSIYKNYG